MLAETTSPGLTPPTLHSVATSLPEPAAAKTRHQTWWTEDGRPLDWVGLVPVLLLAGLLIALYERIAVKLVADWYNFPDSSHGLLIPFFVLFLLWDRRSALAAVPVRPSWSGTPLAALGLLVLLVGVFGADLFLSRVSFVILAAGMVWTLFGKAMLHEVRFILFVCFLGIPLPTIIINKITFHHQKINKNVSAALLPLAGVPVLREGNVIQLPAMSLEVAEACSGIRSLMSLFTVAVIYGYFMERSTARRVILALASIPIAVVANSARIFGTGLCVQYWDPEKAMGFFHEFSGWLIFLVSLACLYLVHTAMRLIRAERAPRTGAQAGGAV